MSTRKGKEFYFTEKQVHNEVRQFIKKQDLNDDHNKNILIKKCTWTEIKISQEVKSQGSKKECYAWLQHVIKRHYKQKYMGGLIN
jgi:hypothetical protein